MRCKSKNPHAAGCMGIFYYKSYLLFYVAVVGYHVSVG